VAETTSLVKHVSVQRSNRVPTLYWWSLPLRLRDAAALFADGLGGARAVVHPASALRAEGAALGARPAPGGAAWVSEVAALLEGRDDGRIDPCTIAIFPPTIRDHEIEPRLQPFHAELERLGFTIAVVPEAEGRARHRFCFRVPGKVIVALEHLAHGRGFGGNPGQVEMALLGGLQLRPKHSAHLQLVLEGGEVQLVGSGGGGRQRITYLESNKGYTGVYEERSWQAAAGERAREAWRRFPVGVVMFIGLPFFIAAFWLQSWFAGRRGSATGTPRATR
jgi:hypothetical protein